MKRKIVVESMAYENRNVVDQNVSGSDVGYVSRRKKRKKKQNRYQPWDGGGGGGGGGGGVGVKKICCGKRIRD